MSPGLAAIHTYVVANDTSLGMGAYTSFSPTRGVYVAHTTDHEIHPLEP
jgi:hypothetical protein